MNKIFRFIFFVFTICLVNSLKAQNISTPAEKVKLRQKNLNRIAVSADSSYQQHLKTAKKLGLSLKDSLGKGKMLRFHSISSNGEPQYLITHSTTQAGKMTKTNSLYKNGSLGLEITGKSDFLKGKLGMWDGGALLDGHIEFTGRTSKQSGQSSTLSSHSTHVAGILIAAGKNSSVLGMSSEADLKYWDFDNDGSEIASASKDLYVSNHSYGIQAGWVYDENRSKWTWWGYDAVSKTEDYKFGLYDDNTRQLDQIAYNAPNYLIVKSAGNSRTENGPAVKATNKNYVDSYYIRNTSTLDSIPRAKNDGYDIISTNANAKNILTVGALESSLLLPSRASAFSLSSYSSWGPTDDGRIKPDIMGIGSNIYSTTNSTSSAVTNLYEYNSGTSMSSPQVAGSLFLLQQLYAQKNNGSIMHSASLKGLAIHTALDIDAAGPDYKTGWGVLDIEKAGKVLLKTDNNHLLSELTLKNTETYKLSVVASGNGPLIATIAWTDPEGKAQGSVLNDRTPRLVNDLDIRIKDDANQFLPFILDPANPDKLATTGDNIRDNIEKIIIPNAIPGKTYEITVSHKGTLTYSAQDYSLILSGINGKPVCDVASAKSAFINRVSINSNSTSLQMESGISTPFTVELSGLNSGIFNAFVDWNQDGDFSDENEWLQNNVNFSSSKISFNASAPSTINPLNNYHLRVVVGQQSVANGCTGSSSNEVREYAISLLEPSYDASIDKLSQSGGAFCAGSENLFYTTVRNAGSKSYGKFEIKLSIYEEGVFKKSFLKTVDSLALNEVKDISLPSDISIQNGKNYRYEVSIISSNDQISGNNLLSQTQLISKATAPTATGLSCSNANTIALSSNNNTFWFDGANALLGVGNNISLPKGKSYYASLGGISQSLGPKTKYDFGTGNYYSNFGPEPILEVKAPMVLESARVYIGTSGIIDFYVSDVNTGELVSFTSINVTATRSQKNIVAPPNQISDDKSDQGMILNLNLDFPKAGTYAITQVCKNGASIYRSNRTKSDTLNAPSNIGFPYNSTDNLISLTSALYQGGLIYSGYYYFYDMKFKSLGCASDKVTASIRDVTSPSISLNTKGPKSICPAAETVNLGVVSNQEISYQWQKNLVDISLANKSTYTPTSTGSYTLKGTNADGCTSTSEAFQLTIYPVITPQLYYNSDGSLQTNINSPISWYLNNTILTGLASSTIKPTQSGTYKVQGIDSNNCPTNPQSILVSILATENEISSLGIYPNPSQGNQVVVEIPRSNISALLTIEVYDLNGQKRLSKTVSNQISNIPMDISSLATGTYLLRIPELYQEKVIKLIKN